MTIYANSSRSLPGSLYRCIPLVLSWFLGILLGCFFAEPFSVSLMRSAVLQPVSIVGVFVCIFLPLIFSFVSFYANKPIIILIVCFLKAVAYGFSCLLVYRTYDSAAWLIQVLFLFSDSCFMIVLFVVWFRRFLGVGSPGVSELWMCTAIGIFLASADYFVISPILEGLF